MRLKDLLFVAAIVGVPTGGVLAYQHYQPFQSDEVKLERLNTEVFQAEMTVRRLEHTGGDYAELAAARRRLQLAERELRRFLD